MNLRLRMGGVVAWLAFVAWIGNSGAPSARADFIVGFDAAGDYAASFNQSRNPSSNLMWRAEGFMRMDPTNSTRLTAFYDTFTPHDNNAPYNTIGGGSQQEVYSLAFRVGHENESVGIAARIQGTGVGTNGYGAWINTDGGDKVLRLYRTVSSDSISTGTQLGTVSLEPNRIVADTWYVIELGVRNLSDGNVSLGARIADRATGSTVGPAIAYTDTAANRVAAGGRLYLTLQTSSSSSSYIDDFKAVVVPDPPPGTVMTVQ